MGVEAAHWTASPDDDDPESHIFDEREQDSDTFAALYRLYRDGVYRYIRTRTQSDEDAVDLTQHVFLRAFENIDRFRSGKGSFLNWLFSIARNAAVDLQRKQRRETSIEGLEFQSLEDVEARGINLADAAGVRSVVLALPDSKQDLLALRFAAQLTVPEIAAVTGRNPDAIYKELSRILEQLRGELT